MCDGGYQSVTSANRGRKFCSKLGSWIDDAFYSGPVSCERKSEIIGLLVSLIQRCQLVRFTRKPYGFLRFAQDYGRTMQSNGYL